MSDGPPEMTGDDEMPRRSRSDDSEIVHASTGYRLLEMIGSGSYGKVWRAEAPGGVPVAIKIVNWPRGHKATKSEVRALELMKQLRHPFLVQLHAYWFSADRLVMVMDLADHCISYVLDDAVRAGKTGLTTAELLRYMDEAAEALDFLHDNDVIHCDIKPDNILLVKGHAKLGDFGVARLLNRDRLDMTATSTGTPLYGAPEVWLNRVSKFSDQYSLAVTYYELRTNRPIFDAQTPFQAMKMHIETPPTLVGLDPSEQVVLQRALAKNHLERFPTCREFVIALRDTQPKETDGLTTKTPRAVQIGLALVVVLLLLGLSYLSMRPQFLVTSELTISAGDQASIEASFVGLTLGRSATLTIDSSQIPGVKFDVDDWPDTGKPQLIRVDVPLQVKPGRYSIALQARLPWASYARVLDLQIVPPHVPNIQGFRPSDDAVPQQSKQDRIAYYSRIVHEVTGIEFVLITRERTDDPPTFYMMIDKVSEKQFLDFVRQATESPELTSQWRDRVAEPGSSLPIFDVTYSEARAFARWIGGVLPSAQQWDKASGMFDHPEGSKGPFDPNWDPSSADQSNSGIALFGAPKPIGSSRFDISAPYGCRDLAGNGYEWTRTMADGSGSPDERPNPDANLLLRGRSFDKDYPLLYEDLEPGSSTRPQQPPGERDSTTSFRVVIET